ncbi:gamma-glutamylcyclotransferase family protein [Vibrio nitrifigilis]|uniref:Gamma-glutamylcyclotransferase n=1 Tax=Vibrio nitrifigilis TaxID=2789781 RepID=A0ABS0GJ27_9VIBR|nr:gamma-glutamylcyclotransferase family protein [Vibrio nitrifigilis]MBF9002428.1 gamma-glutamylcyclotransferase [Vibrio nitrifigilis]
MEKLFSYGTLQIENVQKETFGRLLVGKKEILLGYILSEVKIKDQEVIRKSGKDIHPILKYTGNQLDKVEGTIFEISPEELAQADSYEVEEYVRTKGMFQSGSKAWIYADATQVGNT